MNQALGVSQPLLPRRGLIGRIWIPVLVLSCIAIGLYAVSFVSGRAFPQEVGMNHSGMAVLLTHVVAAGIALMLGPWQFVTAIRVRRPLIHRAMGKGYVIACLVGATAGGVLALGTASGPVARWGFFVLAVAWFGATIAAYMAARRRDFVAHRRWMIRSFTLAFAAVTLRVYLPAALISGVPFAEAYGIIAWASWMPNLIVAEAYLRMSPARGLPAQVTAG